MAPEIIPPLRQSHVETAACPRAYVEIVINKKTQPDSIPSERGSEIHDIMSRYIDHCTNNRISADWAFFDKIAAAAGPVAGPILDGLRDRYQVDWQRVYATELTQYLGEDLVPRAEDAEDISYTGTLDVLLINEALTEAKIEDFKSHPAPFDAETFQSVLYPYMVFAHFPTVQRVTFELNFVRYQNCLRSVAFNRSEMPEMAKVLTRARARQIATHEHPENAMALPCKTCTYCPLAKTMTCPISEWNEYTVLSPQARLMWKEWMRRMSSENGKLLKAYAEVNGAVRYQDGNGKVYEYGEMEVPQTRYPFDETTVQVLRDWAEASGENLLDGRLNVSSTKLKGYLRAKKRAQLQTIFEDSIIETTTKPKYSVRTPEEGIVPDYNPYESED